MYGLHNIGDRRMLWLDLISSLATNMQEPWLQFADYNTVLEMDEKHWELRYY